MFVVLKSFQESYESSQCQKYFNFCCCCNCDDRISKENNLKLHIKRNHMDRFPINNDIVS